MCNRAEIYNLHNQVHLTKTYFYTVSKHLIVYVVNYKSRINSMQGYQVIAKFDIHLMEDQIMKASLFMRWGRYSPEFLMNFTFLCKDILRVPLSFSLWIKKKSIENESP